jgi:serine O-acetyltransferase
VGHWLWEQNRQSLACYLQNRISEVFAVDIHPAARIGKGILIDHATSVVIGETAVVDDDVSMLHEVTLGGTGKETGDRHPKVRRGVLIGAGAKILGNVVIGEGSKVAAGSVVLADVPPYNGCGCAGRHYWAPRSRTALSGNGSRHQRRELGENRGQARCFPIFPQVHRRSL